MRFPKGNRFGHAPSFGAREKTREKFMKKTLKLLVPLLIGAAFAFSFASCSSDDGDGGNQQYYDDNSWDKNVDLFVGHKNLGTNWDSDLALILDGALFSNCNSSDKFTLDFEFESADYYKLKICANIDDWPELKSIVLHSRNVS